MKDNFLFYLQEINSDFIHAKGEVGTEALLYRMNIQGTEQLLEIGCGTGGTLVKIKSRYPKVNLTGLDISQKMLDKARQRMYWCGLANKIDLVHYAQKSSLPTDAFDVVYIESVLAILENDQLNEMLPFIKRVLNQDGLLFINETIWLEQTTFEEINKINKKAKDFFGIIQCRPEFHGIEATKIFFKNRHFDFQASYQLKSQTVLKNRAEYLSTLFTKLGKLKHIISPKLRQSKKHYEVLLKDFFEEEKQYMEGNIFVFRKMYS